MRQSPEKAKPQQFRRKQIEATLNQLHRLQTDIYKLNVPQNPHGSPPVKKEIKQLTYLYQNMTKPKTKNNLNIAKEDIERTLHIVSPGPDLDAPTTSIDGRKLSRLMKEMFGSELDLSLIKKDNDDYQEVTSEELFEFINFNQFDGFDPVREAYDLFVDDNGRFNFDKYKEFQTTLGLPVIKNEQTFKEILGLKSGDMMSFGKFQELLEHGVPQK